MMASKMVDQQIFYYQNSISLLDNLENAVRFRHTGVLHNSIHM